MPGTGASATRPPTGLRARYLMPFEVPRAVVETAALVAVLPPLLDGPRPDDHPVLVVPGVSGGPLWCLALRSLLRARGHTVHRPPLGAMKARRRTVVDRLTRQVVELADGRPARVSLVGWSVGGCLTRQVALAVPHLVRQVVTLGAPVGGLWYSAVPGTANRPMPVPTTAIYSLSDPVFGGPDCRQPPAPQCEDVAIVSSHLGMATHPVACHVITDRLAQPPGAWRPYVAPGPGGVPTPAPTPADPSAATRGETR